MCPRRWASSRPLPMRLQPAPTTRLDDFNTTSVTLTHWRPLPGTKTPSYLVSRRAGAEDEPLWEITPGNRRRRRRDVLRHQGGKEQQRNREQARATTVATATWSQLHYKNHRRWQAAGCLLASCCRRLLLLPVPGRLSFRALPIPRRVRLRREYYCTDDHAN